MAGLAREPSGLAAASRRLALIPVVLGVLLAVTATASAAGLKPDLEALRAGGFKLCQESLTTLERSDACHGTGRTVLRLTGRVANSGVGPLEFGAVAPADDIPEDCHGNGDVDIDGDGIPDDDDTWVEQRIYNDANNDGIFQRATDTGYTSTVVGCRYYHPEHHHYHLDGYARFLLYSEATGDLARTGNKISFCVTDSNDFSVRLPGAPSSPYYTGTACKRKLATNGTSVGWYDQYPWRLPGQEIDVTGLPAGIYCLVVQADPDNMLLETNDSDNDYQVRVSLDPTKAPVNSYVPAKPLSGPCTFGSG